MVGIRSRNFYHQVNLIPSVVNVPPVVSSKSIFEIVDIVLLGGGSKATQINDIAKALDLNRNFEDHAP
jgi:hypothetical protein